MSDPIRDMVYQIQESPRLVALALTEDPSSLEKIEKERRKQDPSRWVIQGYTTKACEKLAMKLIGG